MSFLVALILMQSATIYTWTRKTYDTPGYVLTADVIHTTKVGDWNCQITFQEAGWLKPKDLSLEAWKNGNEAKTPKEHLARVTWVASDQVKSAGDGSFIKNCAVAFPFLPSYVKSLAPKYFSQRPK